MTVETPLIALEATRQCPAAPIWLGLPPNLGTGIPARLRAGRPVLPRFLIVDKIPLAREGREVRSRADAVALANEAIEGEILKVAACQPAEPKPRIFIRGPVVKKQVANPPPPQASLTASFDKDAPSSGLLDSDCLAAAGEPFVPQPLRPSAMGVGIAAKDVLWRKAQNALVAPRKLLRPAEPLARAVREPSAKGAKAARSLCEISARAWELAIGPAEPWSTGVEAMAAPDALTHAVAVELAGPEGAQEALPLSVFDEAFEVWATAPNSYVRKTATEPRLQNQTAVPRPLSPQNP